MSALFRFLSLCPLPVLHGAGWCLGWISWLFSSRYRHRLWSHARMARTPTRAVMASIGQAGQMVAELPRLWFGRPVRVGWEGAAHIEAAHAHGRGIVFLTPHMGSFEITAQAYAQRFGQLNPITVLFRPPHQAWLRSIVEQARQRPGLKTAPTTLAGVKQLIKALKAGETVGLLPDQVPPQGQGVWAPFFGRDAYTMTLSARLVHSCDAVLLLAWGERLSWGRGFIVHVRPFDASGVPDAAALPADPVEAATRINQAMEQVITERPSQYLWSYNRYKPPA